MKNTKIPDENSLRMQLLCGREIYCRIRYHHDSKEEDVCMFWSNYHHAVGVDHLPGPGRYSMSYLYEEDFPFDILYIEGKVCIARIRWNANDKVESARLFYDKGGRSVTVEPLATEGKSSNHATKDLPFKILSEELLEE